MIIWGAFSVCFLLGLVVRSSLVMDFVWCDMLVSVNVCVCERVCFSSVLANAKKWCNTV